MITFPGDPLDRPADYLRQNLKSAFGASEIRKIEAGLGVDHPHQGDAGKIVPLGNHLGADQNIGGSVGHPREDAVMADGTADTLVGAPTITKGHVVPGVLLRWGDQRRGQPQSS